VGAISEALRQELLEDAIPNNAVVEPELSRDGDTDESEGLGGSLVQQVEERGYNRPSASAS
jgi:hypothetical protein